MRFARKSPWAAALLCGLAGLMAQAEERVQDVRVAVAANFKQTAAELCRVYFAARPGRCVLTAGASGLLYAKVAQGAPFDVLLSADAARAKRLEAAGLAAPGTRFTYAIGRLVLWRPGHAAGKDLRAALADDGVHTIAIANPGAAPYGIAALETLRALGIPTAGRFRLVQGESVAQTFQFVATGAADAGFVALSQVLEFEAASRRRIASEVILVDPTLYRPIEQQAVLLGTARENAAARGLLEFLRSPAARRIIDAAGYASRAP